MVTYKGDDHEVSFTYRYQRSSCVHGIVRDGTMGLGIQAELEKVHTAVSHGVVFEFHYRGKPFPASHWRFQRITGMVVWFTLTDVGVVLRCGKYSYQKVDLAKYEVLQPLPICFDFRNETLVEKPYFCTRLVGFVFQIWN
ncbi:hypothetical protein FRX31_025431 [Thalictrum thalictroides]|uniref:Uncharacterized protein n=1 Tax=Thalictrum thalictroides TaxID=46969 RepID=A0A7J6VJA2_THATH|nr:hypothetical protein FRX31_025431 [Thalictrum thalictroides]